MRTPSIKNRVRTWTALAAGALMGSLVLSPPVGAAPTDPAAADTQRITIDGNSSGRTFDGVGAISASSSRLLVDYPDEERDEILDYLFKPNYGASLQIFKVEIGADTNSTAGAEPGHQRVRGEIDCGRGFEWWMMEEAVERNPDIDLYGLGWGFPGWFDTGWLWGQDHVDYIISWLDCADQRGFEIDYIGAANERGGYNIPFLKNLGAALEENYPDVQLVATDQHKPPNYWYVTEDMATDPELNDAIDIVGQHVPCGWRTKYQDCETPQLAQDLNKPLWTSEASTQDAAAGAGPMARSRIRNYVDGKMTGDIHWSAVAAFYGNFHTAGTGLMNAEWPWTGYYKVQEPIWIEAHTTQFTEPGWQYLDSASGYTDAGASHTALKSDTTDDWSAMIETLDSTGPETIEFTIEGGLSTDRVQVWSTRIDSDDEGEVFARQRPIRVRDGRFTIVVEPGHMYTLSTTTEAHKGDAEPSAGQDEILEMPFTEDFENTGEDLLARGFSDLNGGFEAAECGGDRDGTCYRQVITEQPINWQRGGLAEPSTLVGDPRWWGDYRVSADAMLEQPGHVQVMGRIDRYSKPEGGDQGGYGTGETGYHLQVSDTGAWTVYREGTNGEQNDLATGQLEEEFGVGQWHTLELEFEGDRITAMVDGVEIATVTDTWHNTGLVGLRNSMWQNAQFDNVRVEQINPGPQVMNRSRITATATAEQDGVYEHHFYHPEWTLDGRLMSQWMTPVEEGDQGLPESITLDLHPGRARMNVDGLVYTPPVGNVRVDETGLITEYTISLSLDGENFTEVASGEWEPTTATKVVRWDEPQRAKYVRLTATSADGAPVAAAAELNVIARGGGMVERVWGSDRYGTAAAVSELFPEGADTVYVTSGQGFADAMAGGPGAARGLVPGVMETPEGDPAPVLLVGKNRVPAITHEAIEDVDPDNIVILGGEGIVSGQVEDEVRANHEGSTVSRVEGADRYETAANLAKMFPTDLPVVYLASGENPAYPDALTGGALAGKYDAPVLLTRKGALPAATADALEELNPGQVVVLGGTAAVSDAVYDAVGASERLWGSDRYGTAVAVSNDYATDVPVLYIASGQDYPDALSGSALAGFEDVPVLITRQDRLPQVILDELDRLSPERVVILGGTAAVSQDVEDKLNESYPGWIG